MTPTLIIDRFAQAPPTQELLKTLQEKRHGEVMGLSGSFLAFLLTALYKKHSETVVCLLGEQEEAAYLYNDLQMLVSQEELLYFPSSYLYRHSLEQFNPDGVLYRCEVQKRLSHSLKCLIITYVDAVCETISPPETFAQNSITLRRGEKLSQQSLIDFLTEHDFQRENFTYEAGQFSVRGSLVDVFSYASEKPFRMDFFGDEIDSIRLFEMDSQLSDKQVDEVTIVPTSREEEKTTLLFDTLPQDSLLWVKHPGLLWGMATERLEQVEKRLPLEQEVKPRLPLVSGESLRLSVERCMTVFQENSKTAIHFHSQPPIRFHKNMQLLVDDMLYRRQDKDMDLVVSAAGKSQQKRLQESMAQYLKELPVSYLSEAMQGGFYAPDMKLALYTDHEIFDRHHRFRLRTRTKQTQAITLKELTQLRIGDYVVHSEHGIGKFGGMVSLDQQGVNQEAVKLIYQEGDILLVNIHSLHRITKYSGKESEPPKLYRLGKGEWQRLKQRAKEKVKDIAHDLIALYAKRMEAKGFAFSKDTYLQQELEASFLYEDTPDQLLTTQAIKEDMESRNPMDRLVCGDVGFGKTEVAIRAAFKAVNDSKQVLVLVPTTLLALQHYQTFSERLKEFPCTVDYISRMRKGKETKEILRKLKEGELDVVIGTHRLLNKDVVPKDLGLFIIDEEQRFGVSAKEKLKSLRANVDVLTLTATPIPRTLQFSLMGARDLSIIRTPPPNRYPIATEFTTFNEEAIREAILYEVSRQGQVFLIHNRISGLSSLEAMVHRNCRGVRTVIVHGQLSGNELEERLVDFMRGDYDVLIATSILESGLDIPNANTIVINDAHRFGLSELHQLRGRVGRGNQKAYCLLLAPPSHLIASDARRRLKAISEHTDLGSGFNLALMDLDIRGAGNLLGAEQSGFISNIGYETYCRILEEAVKELKETTFQDLFRKRGESPGVSCSGEKMPVFYADDCVVETDMQLLFPASYISDESERLSLYRQFDNVANDEEWEQFVRNVEDRFGKLPDEANDLLQSYHIRQCAMRLGWEKVILKKQRMIGYFISDSRTPLYETPLFGHIIETVQRHDRKTSMKEKNGRLIITIREIDTIQKAHQFLREMLQFEQPQSPVPQRIA